MRHIVNRFALILCLICVGVLFVGVALEATMGGLLFDNYISACTGWGFILMLIYAATRPARTQVVTGFCHHCGYDLRASIGRCPECGTVIPLPLANHDGSTPD